MNFYSTYYKKQANYDQISILKDKFEELDANGDKALNDDELANIFTNQSLTQNEKSLLIQGTDGDDDSFLSFLEFTRTFIEFDIDQDAEISEDESEFAFGRIEELKKQLDINDQYRIISNLDSTDQEKQEAEDKIEIFNVERNIIYLELDVQKKEILIDDRELQIQNIQESIDNNTLLEFEAAKKVKEMQLLDAEKDILVLKKNISQSKLDLESVNLITINKQRDRAQETDPDVIQQLNKEIAVLEQQKISGQSDINTKERELELHHLQVKIEDKENLLTKFFVPEFIKNGAREELEKLRDEQSIANQRIELYEKISGLSFIRSELIDKLHLYESTDDSDEQEQIQQVIDQLEAQEDIQQIEATISSKKVELYDKKMQLKRVLPKSEYSPFDRIKLEIETEIATLEQEIAALEAQL